LRPTVVKADRAMPVISEESMGFSGEVCDEGVGARVTYREYRPVVACLLPRAFPHRSSFVAAMNTRDSSRPIELFLLGGFELRGAPGAGDAVLAQSKTLALLAFLAMSPPSLFQRRDRVVGLLWPDLDQSHARAALRKTLHELRSALGPHVLSVRGDDEIAVAPGAVRCDAVEFTAAIEHQHIARALELSRLVYLSVRHW
jgi:two-component SAPR family response regulator